ncbi:CU044_5270 family protein [Streptomyces sp. NPDC004330]|uniref:CU044_5270 family protein n=1 Tax=Streptomyces sp. NPDC004330 TaxID=3364700 RepID=UPI0036C4743C
MNTPTGFKERLGAELAILEKARAERAAHEASRNGQEAAARRIFRRTSVRRGIAFAGLTAAVATTFVAASGGPGGQNGPVRAVTVAQVLDAAALGAAKGSGREPGPRQWVYTKTVVCESTCGPRTSWARYDGAQAASVGKAPESQGRTAVLVSENIEFLRLGKIGEDPQKTWRVLSQLPTDPAELLARVSKDPYFAAGYAPDTRPDPGPNKMHDFGDELPEAATPGARFARILYILRVAPNIPPEINAALYRALALIPGAELVDTLMKDAAGRPSLTISFAFHDRNNTVEYLHLNPETYAYRGLRRESHGPGGYTESYARTATGIVDHPGQVPGGPVPDPSDIVMIEPPIVHTRPVGP